MSQPQDVTRAFPRLRLFAGGVATAAAFAALAGLAVARSNEGSEAPGRELVAVEANAPARPGGVITYEVTGKGLFTSTGGGTALGTTSVEHLHAEGHVASPVESAVSPDGTLTATVERRPGGVFLVLSGGGRPARDIAQLAAGDDPQLVAGGKGHARAVAGVPLVVAWSPDSKSLAFGSVVEPFTLGVLTHPDASEPVIRYAEVSGGYVGELAWSPDGSKLAISTYSLDRTEHSVLIASGGSMWTNRLVDGCHITWSPDSGYVAVHRDPGAEAGAWVVSTANSGERWPISMEVMAFPLTWREG